jgi:hypothetical protein
MQRRSEGGIPTAFYNAPNSDHTVALVFGGTIVAIAFIGVVFAFLVTVVAIAGLSMVAGIVALALFGKPGSRR